MLTTLPYGHGVPTTIHDDQLYQENFAWSKRFIVPLIIGAIFGWASGIPATSPLPGDFKTRLRPLAPNQSTRAALEDELVWEKCFLGSFDTLAGVFASWFYPHGSCQPNLTQIYSVVYPVTSGFPQLCLAQGRCPPQTGPSPWRKWSNGSSHRGTHRRHLHLDREPQCAPGLFHGHLGDRHCWNCQLYCHHLPCLLPNMSQKFNTVISKELFTKRRDMKQDFLREI